MITVRVSDLKALAPNIRDDELKRVAYFLASSKIDMMINEIRKTGDPLLEATLKNPGYQKLLDEIVEHYLEKLEPLKIERDIPPLVRYTILLRLLDSIHICFLMKAMGMRREVIEKYLPRALTYDYCEVVIIDESKRD